MSDDPKHVTVRLRVSPELRDKIAESAKAHNRSMNADMVARLQSSFESLATPLTTSELMEMLLNRFPAGMIEIRLGKIDEDNEKL